MASTSAPQQNPRRGDTPVAQPAVVGNDYRSGGLSEGRAAIIKDLGQYIELPFSTFIESTFHFPSEAECSRMRQGLADDRILTIGLRGEARWTLFQTAPSGSKKREDEAFGPFGDIITAIFKRIPSCPMSFVANPNRPPFSDRKNSSRPDAYIQLDPAIKHAHWFDIAASFEFKKGSHSYAVNDDKQKIIWSLHNVMREDPLRRFAFGFTIEDTKMRLWYSNRAFLAASEPIDIMKDIDKVISLFLSIGTKGKTELGWDPSIERIRIQKKTQYKFKVNDQLFTTTRPIATYGADSIVGRGVRVYEARDQNGSPVVIKDSWRAESCTSEGEILEKILFDIREVLGDAEANEAEKYIIKIRTFEDVCGGNDKTFNPIAEEDLSWITISTDIMDSSSPSESSSRTSHLSSVGHVPLSVDTDSSIQAGVIRGPPPPCRVHTRAVFEEVGETLASIDCLVDGLNCLSGAQKALYYLHKAGWMHRDISINNILRVVKDGSQIGKLTDFEYAKKKDSTTSHEVRTGTLGFMAVEVESQSHLFLPDGRDPPEDDDMTSESESDSISLPMPPFQMNPIHDLESLWWCTIWILLYHTDVHSPAEDMNAQQASLQTAFPGQPEHILRFCFFTLHPLRKQARKTLSKTYRNKCASIFKLADTLKRHYKALENNYPVLLPFNFPSDDALESLHKHMSNAYEHIINELDGSGAPQVRLQSLLDLIKERKEAVEDSGSDQPAKKKARQA